MLIQAIYIMTMCLLTFINVYFQVKYDNLKISRKKINEVVKFIDMSGIKNLDIIDIIKINNDIDEILKLNKYLTKTLVIKEIIKNIMNNNSVFDIQFFITLL
jgi:hypothetical protein